ncbi:hypothetical protein E6C27_scaffold34G00620 [Cucumis melo var. makuwa]|uniref:Uncharacterized protein n=1 Tax=Cucumis melo var. makuwa TaxID=1194695 RepID=A0A5A7SI23_CUCMM|nr:hypothetical protein E6C27_scaffold34G00620 [Cucumis melo var. makuwa]
MIGWLRERCEDQIEDIGGFTWREKKFFAAAATVAYPIRSSLFRQLSRFAVGVQPDRSEASRVESRVAKPPRQASRTLSPVSRHRVESRASEAAASRQSKLVSKPSSSIAKVSRRSRGVSQIASSPIHATSLLGKHTRLAVRTRRVNLQVLPRDTEDQIFVPTGAHVARVRERARDWVEAEVGAKASWRATISDRGEP